MPVRTRKYDRRYAEPFFDNLIPEGDALTKSDIYDKIVDIIEKRYLAIIADNA